MTITRADATAAARNLARYLQAHHGLVLNHTRALAAVAALQGERNVHTASARRKRRATPTVHSFPSELSANAITDAGRFITAALNGNLRHPDDREKPALTLLGSWLAQQPAAPAPDAQLPFDRAGDTAVLDLPWASLAITRAADRIIAEVRDGYDFRVHKASHAASATNEGASRTYVLDGDTKMALGADLVLSLHQQAGVYTLQVDTGGATAHGPQDQSSTLARIPSSPPYVGDRIEHPMSPKYPDYRVTDIPDDQPLIAYGYFQVTVGEGFEENMFVQASGDGSWEMTNTYDLPTAIWQVWDLSRLTVPAFASSADEAVTCSFDATEWLDDASDDAIRSLAGEGWGAGGTSDQVADHYSTRDINGTKKLFTYIAAGPKMPMSSDPVGFACNINPTAALARLAETRPRLADELRSFS